MSEYVRRDLYPDWAASQTKNAFTAISREYIVAFARPAPVAGFADSTRTRLNLRACSKWNAAKSRCPVDSSNWAIAAATWSTLDEFIRFASSSHTRYSRLIRS